MKAEGIGSGMDKAAGTGGDLISRSALMEGMAGISLDGEKAVCVWVEAELLIEEAPAVTPPVRDGAEKFVSCGECSNCCRSLKDGRYFCGSWEGMHGWLHPEGGDGCSHGIRIMEGQGRGC